MKKKFTKKERKVFAPLMRYEDKQHALWFSMGAGLVIIFWLLSLIK